MKDSSAVLAYIDESYRVWSENPRAFARDPQTLEAVFIEFEHLRDLILSQDELRPWDSHWYRNSGYTRFLHARYPEIGASCFTTRYKRDDASEEVEFSRFVAVWSEYLQSGFRMQVASDAEEEGPPNEHGPL